MIKKIKAAIVKALSDAAVPTITTTPVVTKTSKGFFSIKDASRIVNKEAQKQELIKRIIPRGLAETTPVGQDGKAVASDAVTHNGFTMDSHAEMKTAFDLTMPQVSGVVGEWFGAQSFIGTQMCAILAQQWLIDKACKMPADDAIRKGWDVSINLKDAKLTDEQLDEIRDLDIKYKVVKNLVEYIQFSRVFGIRIAIFLVDSDDPKYYEKPFNIDGVGAGKYKGISQIDPYWLAPELDMSASADPINLNFYEPTWWRMSGLRVHRSHLCVLVPSPVADVLKPTYFFGGVPLTQKIYERVYNAERCATESPQLLMTKRANVITMDIEKAMSDPDHTEAVMQAWSMYRDNYGIKAIGDDERFEQHDTSLSDLDTTILTQYELVAAIAGVPSSKLLGQAPSGSLNAAGDYERASYHEMLESMQANDLTPLLDRHYMLLCKSELAEKYPELKDANLVVRWKELNSMTEMDRADVNQKKAQTDETLINAGVINAEMAHDRIIRDNDSGYGGYVGDDFEPEDDDQSNEPDDNGAKEDDSE